MRTTSAAFRCLPIVVAPPVKSGDKWSSDPEGGKQEIIDRGVGKYELDALLAIADAQDEFTALDLSKSGGRVMRKFIGPMGKRTDSSSA